MMISYEVIILNIILNVFYVIYINETLCFIKRNIVFHNKKLYVSTEETNFTNDK